MTITIDTTGLTQSDVTPGDRVILRDDRSMAASAGAEAIVTGFKDYWTLLKWDRSDNLADTQRDGAYSIGRFELVPEKITVEDLDGLDALPVGTVLRLATEHLLVRKVEKYTLETSFLGQRDVEYVWHGLHDGAPIGTASRMTDGNGWLPATVENPEILGTFRPIQFEIGQLVRVTSTHEKGFLGYVESHFPDNGDDVKVNLIEMRGRTVSSPYALSYKNENLLALDYFKGEEVIVNYDVPSQSARDYWSGPATIYADVPAGTTHGISVNASNGHVGGFPPSMILRPSEVEEAVEVEIIEEAAPLPTFEVEDKVVVTGDEGGAMHSFEAGQILTVIRELDGDDEHLCVDSEGTDYYVSNVDLLPLEDALGKATALVLA